MGDTTDSQRTAKIHPLLQRTLISELFPCTNLWLGTLHELSPESSEHPEEGSTIIPMCQVRKLGLGREGDNLREVLQEEESQDRI